MNKEKTGIIKIKKVLKYISNNYDVKKSDVTYNKDGIFQFEIITNKKYEIKETITLEFNDIKKIIEKILNEDNIKINNITPKIEHIPGDYFEPLDYGYYELIGFQFSIIN